MDPGRPPSPSATGVAGRKLAAAEVSGYRVIDEISTLPHTRGAVGISKMIRDTGDSQLYITHLPTPHLDGRYTVIGYVIEGLEVLDKLELSDTIVSARVIE